MASLVERKFKSGSVFYIQYWEGGKSKRIRAHESEQIAEDMLHKFKMAQIQGDAGDVFPTKTPIAEVVSDYIEHVRVSKTPKSAQTLRRSVCNDGQLVILRPFTAPASMRVHGP
jgi:hypothetical protein